MWGLMLDVKCVENRKRICKMTLHRFIMNKWSIVSSARGQQHHSLSLLATTAVSRLQVNTSPNVAVQISLYT